MPIRVIGGSARGRKLKLVPGDTTRPVMDRVKEALFNIISGDILDSTFLDLFAGTGSIGIEALSRGARMVHFVESSKAAAELIAANLKSLGITRGFQIIRVGVGKALRQLEEAGSVADFVFLDPPYSMQEEYAKTLAALAESKLLRERTLVIAEHEKRFDPGEAFAELGRYRKLVQGDTALSFYRRRV